MERLEYHIDSSTGIISSLISHPRPSFMT